MGLLAPLGVPEHAITTIDAAMQRALATKEMVSALEAMGALPASVGPKAFAALIAKESANYAGIVQRAGVTPD